MSPAAHINMIYITITKTNFKDKSTNIMSNNTKLVAVPYTVKPVNKGHSREREHMVFTDKWSLFGGHFV